VASDEVGGVDLGIGEELTLFESAQGIEARVGGETGLFCGRFVTVSTWGVAGAGEDTVVLGPGEGSVAFVWRGVQLASITVMGSIAVMGRVVSISVMASIAVMGRRVSIAVLASIGVRGRWVSIAVMASIAVMGRSISVMASIVVMGRRFPSR
jgi:hypothetical protein